MYKNTAFLRNTACFICFFSFFIFAGCKDKTDPPGQPQVVSKKIVGQNMEMVKRNAATEIKKQTVKTEKPGVEKQKAASSLSVLPKVELAYNSIGKIDPFIPLLKGSSAIATGVKRKEKKRRMPLTPLEKVDLSQLTLQGIVQASSGSRAIVTEASGKGYVIRVGTFIGTKSGRVHEILRDRVIVEEEVENVLGKVTLQNRELKLQKPPGE